jgi:glutamate synthase (NADPH/NADH) small chain
MAIGQGPNPLVPSTTPGLDTTKWGNIIADETSGATSLDGVFAGGDIVTGAATVILAMGAGRNSARAIDDYLRKR